MRRATARLSDDQSAAARRRAPATKSTIATPADNSAEEANKIDESRRRRQISHDIRHELGTIMMLTSVLSSSKDIGRHGRTRARQILGQTRSLEELFRAYEDGLVAPPVSQEGIFAGIRLDRVAADIVRPIRLSTSTQISYDAIEVSANVDRLGFYRAFRNIIGNAVEAAGPDGTVTVLISAVDGLAVLDVDVDGPDLDAVQPISALSLGIAEEFVRPLGGQVQIRRGSPGRGVRVLFPLIANGYTPMQTVPNA